MISVYKSHVAWAWANSCQLSLQFCRARYAKVEQIVFSNYLRNKEIFWIVRFDTVCSATSNTTINGLGLIQYACIQSNYLRVRRFIENKLLFICSIEMMM